MTDSQDQPPDPAYSPEDLRQFARTLGIPDLSPAHIKQMESAALGYLFLDLTEANPGASEKWLRLLPTRKERRNALQRVAKAARALKDALENQALIFLEKKDKLPAPDPGALDALATTAVKAAERIPGGGDDPKLARITFVRRLADIFEDATPNQATRRHDGITGLDYGPFLEFAQAALKPLNARALKGLEHDVRRVAEERSAK